MTDYTDLARRLREAADLIDAMGQQEPDGEVVAGTGSLNDVAMIRWCSDYRPKIGDRIYAAPQPQEQREQTLSEKLREAGFTRRPSWRSLPSDSMDDEPTEAQIEAGAEAIEGRQVFDGSHAREIAEQVLRAALAAKEVK